MEGRKLLTERALMEDDTVRQRRKHTGMKIMKRVKGPCPF